MQDSCPPARCSRDPKGRPPYLHVFPQLTPERRPPVAACHLPTRVVGRRNDGTHIVTASGKPSGHFSRILANARKFGSEVHTVNQHFHVPESEHDSAQTAP